MEPQQRQVFYIPHYAIIRNSPRMALQAVYGKSEWTHLFGLYFPAMEGQEVLNNTKELTDDRQKTHKCCL